MPIAPVQISELPVTGTTTVADLRDFLESKGGGLKLRGKTNPDKSVTLYLDSKSSSKWERMTGAALRRNKLAKQAVDKVFTNFDKLAVKHGASDERGTSIGKRLLSNITDRLASGRHALRAGPLRALAASTTVVGTSLGLPTDLAAEPAAKAPSAKESAARGPVVNLTLAPFNVTQSASRVLAASDPTSRAAALTAIADLIHNGLEGSALTPDIKNAVVLSAGDSVRDQVETAISDRIKGQGGQPPGVLKALVTEAFDQVASRALGTRQVGPRTPTVLDGKQTAIDLPTIEIRGEQYTAKKYLGAGGFGEVFLYASVNDPAKTVAFKIILPGKLGDPETAGKVKGEAINEVMAHARAAHSEVTAHAQSAQVGPSNVIGFKGVVRLDDGTLGVAVEPAPNGSVFDLAESLKGLTGAGPGQITGRQADLIRLATFKGLLQGLRSINQQNMIHFDFKTANCLIGLDGLAKVIDFGASASSRAVGLLDLPVGLDNPRYLAPEIQTFQLDTADAKDAGRAANRTALMPDLVTLFGPPTKMRSDGVTPDMTKYLQNADLIFNHHEGPTMPSVQAAGRPPIDHKQDVWGAGMALFELFNGKQWMPNPGPSEIENTIGAWASNPQGGLSKTPAVGNLIPSTGDDGIDALLNKLLAADPADRINVDQALADVVFQRPDIDDPTLPQFLPSLMQHAKASQDCEEERERVGQNSRDLGTYMLSDLGGVLTDADKARLRAADCDTAERKAILGRMTPADQAKVQAAADALTAAETALAAFEVRRGVTAAGVDTAKAGIARLA